MQYIGPVFQRLWAEEQPDRTASRHRRPAVVPGSVRRRTAPKRARTD